MFDDIFTKLSGQQNVQCEMHRTYISFSGKCRRDHIGSKNTTLSQYVWWTGKDVAVA